MHKTSIFTCKCSANKRLFSTWQFLRFFSLSSKTLDKNVYTSRTSMEEGSNSSACTHTKKQKKHSKGESFKRSKLQGYCQLCPNVDTLRLYPDTKCSFFRYEEEDIKLISSRRTNGKGLLLTFESIALNLIIFSSFNPCPSLPSGATDDGNQL